MIPGFSFNEKDFVMAVMTVILFFVGLGVGLGYLLAKVLS